jgi:hypothetical protein
MKDAKTEQPEVLKSLPVGHPQAGYVSPDTSYVDGVGQRPADEQAAADEAIAAREDEVKAVAENEHSVATAEAAAAEGAQPKEAAPTTSTSSSKSS